MKYIKIIFALVLAIATAIFLLMIFNYKEGFLPDYSDYNTIDRIQTENGYEYCLGGKVECPVGDLIKNDSYSQGITYNNFCNDDFSQPICSNNIASNMSQTEKNNYKVNYIPFPFLQSGFTIDYNDTLPFTIDISNNINFYKNNNIVGTLNKCDMLFGNNNILCNNALSNINSILLFFKC